MDRQSDEWKIGKTEFLSYEMEQYYATSVCLCEFRCLVSRVWKLSIFGLLPPLHPLPAKCSYFTSSYPIRLFGSGCHSQPLPPPLPKPWFSLHDLEKNLVAVKSFYTLQRSYPMMFPSSPASSSIEKPILGLLAQSHILLWLSRRKFSIKFFYSFSVNHNI